MEDSEINSNWRILIQIQNGGLRPEIQNDGFIEKLKMAELFLSSLLVQIKKPVVKQWCYKPSDLKNPDTRNILAQFMTR
jgi:hypothetical protein